MDIFGRYLPSKPQNQPTLLSRQPFVLSFCHCSHGCGALGMVEVNYGRCRRSRKRSVVETTLSGLWPPLFDSILVRSCQQPHKSLSCCKKFSEILALYKTECLSTAEQNSNEISMSRMEQKLHSPFYCDNYSLHARK